MTRIPQCGHPDCSGGWHIPDDPAVAPTPCPHLASPTASGKGARTVSVPVAVRMSWRVEIDVPAGGTDIPTVTRDARLKASALLALMGAGFPVEFGPIGVNERGWLMVSPDERQAG